MMNTNESSENYLETILMLSKTLPVVRGVDIANHLGFKKSSVSVAMKNLREKKHITVTDAGYIYLTDSGREIAEMIYERHEFISKWLISLGVSKEVALEDACRIEHVISRKSRYRRSKRFRKVHFIKDNRWKIRIRLRRYNYKKRGNGRLSRTEPGI